MKLLFSGNLKAFGSIFMLISFFYPLGIGISVFSLAKVITWLLVAHPVLVWSFFFGLVLASTWFVSKDIKEWNWKTIAGFVAGAIIAFYITIATPAETSAEWWFILFVELLLFVQ